MSVCIYIRVAYNDRTTKIYIEIYFIYDYRHRRNWRHSVIFGVKNMKTLLSSAACKRRCVEYFYQIFLLNEHTHTHTGAHTNIYIHTHTPTCFVVYILAYMYDETRHMYIDVYLNMYIHKKKDLRDRSLE